MTKPYIPIWRSVDDFLEGEAWCKISGYVLAYQVSNYGRVWSPGRSGKGKFLKPGIASNGYPTVSLGRGKSRTLHSLVAHAFIGPRPLDCEVLHTDGERLNPSASNLGYGTYSDNMYDRGRHGRNAGFKPIRGLRTAASFRKAWETRRQRKGQGVAQ